MGVYLIPMARNSNILKIRTSKLAFYFKENFLTNSLLQLVYLMIVMNNAIHHV